MRGQQCGLIHGFYYSLRWLLWTILVRVILQVSLLSLNNYKSENNRTAEWVSPYDRVFFSRTIVFNVHKYHMPPPCNTWYTNKNVYILRFKITVKNNVFTYNSIKLI